MENLVNNLDLFMILREQQISLSDSKKLFQFLQNKINVTEENSVVLKKFCTRFCSNICARWERSNRTLAQFIRKNSDWLESTINWPEGMIPKATTEQEVFDYNTENVENLPPSTTEASTSTFTPRKPFEELGSRQKRRRVEQINQSLSLSPEELNATTISSLKNTGNEDIGNIMNHLLNHPEDLEKVKQFLSANITKKTTTHSPDKALSLLVSLKLSKWQYISLREAASENGSNLYPSYYKIQQAKANCYPEKKDMIISEEGADIKIQALLNLTVSRLLDVIALDLDSATELVLISKWGFDGASGQSSYKQKTEAEFDDTTIIMASLLPVRLQRCDGIIVWENDRPSSTFYCRPIMFKFTKETKSTVTTIKASITQQIEKLQQLITNQVKVKHELHMTMIDGKITSYLSDTSSAVCDICKAKPSEMNNLELLTHKENNEEMFQYGLSSLHAWIRCMECLLHIAYRLDFKKWTCRGDDKEKMSLRKSAIQQAFKKECGLIIDVVKQGVGTTNDGNTARRFFRDAETTARITGIDIDLIERFHVILQAVASGERVDISKFSEFCRDTAQLYVSLYPWYYMPSSMHKLLVHGSDIIKYFGAIPIGKLSEEAAEARNKDFRKYRESHSRKVSRAATNEDILHNLLLSSDPKITSLRPRMVKQDIMALSPKVKELLLSFPTESNIDFIDVDNLQDSHSDSE